MYKIPFSKSGQMINNAGRIFITIVILSMHASCSPEARLQRLLTHHPELSTTDSIHVKDTVIIPGMKFDTSFIFSTRIDSVVFQKDKVHLVLKKVHDTLVIHGAVEKDTVYVSRVVPVSKIKIVKPSFLSTLKSMLPWLVIGLITLTVLAVYLHKWSS
jgi:hypothetical protein